MSWRRRRARLGRRLRKHPAILAGLAALAALGLATALVVSRASRHTPAAAPTSSPEPTIASISDCPDVQPESLAVVVPEVSFAVESAGRTLEGSCRYAFSARTGRVTLEAGPAPTPAADVKRLSRDLPGSPLAVRTAWPSGAVVVSSETAEVVTVRVADTKRRRLITATAALPAQRGEAGALAQALAAWAEAAFRRG